MKTKTSQTLLAFALTAALSSLVGLGLAQTNPSREVKGAISTTTLGSTTHASNTDSLNSAGAYQEAILTAPEKVKSLIQIDEKIGSGSDDATPGQYLEVHYTGWIYDPSAVNRHGTKFDSSRDSDKPLTFQLDARSVIRGWDLGLRGMKVGGKRTLIIPAYLAYGTRGSNSIPPNSTLIFDIELLSTQ